MKTSFAVIYRPPKSSLMSSLEEVESTLDQLCTSSDNIVLLGDLNIDLLRHDIVGYKQLDIILNSFDMKQVTTVPTRISANSVTLIDVICISRSMQLPKIR
nr:unnamed protein product [Callosobruchus analis]